MRYSGNRKLTFLQDRNVLGTHRCSDFYYTPGHSLLSPTVSHPTHSVIGVPSVTMSFCHHCVGKYTALNDSFSDNFSSFLYENMEMIRYTYSQFQSAYFNKTPLESIRKCYCISYYSAHKHGFSRRNDRRNPE